MLKDRVKRSKKFEWVVPKKKVFIAMVSVFYSASQKSGREKSDRDSLEYLLRRKGNF